VCSSDLEGDGIGPEIMAPTLEILDVVATRIGLKPFKYISLPAGAAHFLEHGEDLPKDSIAKARQADAILLSAMGLPDIRRPDGTELVPQIDLRLQLELYAGVRPVKVVPGQPCPLKDPRSSEIDFVIVRESTEGLFANLGEGKLHGRDSATETLEITRATSEKLFDFSFRLAQRRAKVRGKPAKVTCVDKANVFQAFWFFRSIFNERAAIFPDIEADAVYVDAFAMWMVLRPWEFDVVVTENMFGDILSDLGAGIIGSLGLAPSADIGDKYAVFQPCHGSAPDIAGKGIANPIAMILSAAMMLDWLAEGFDDDRLAAGAKLIDNAVESLLKSGEKLTADLDGDMTTIECANDINRRIQALS